MEKKIASAEYRKSIELLDKADEAIKALEKGVYSTKKPLIEIKNLAEERRQAEIEDIFYRHKI